MTTLTDYRPYYEVQVRVDEVRDRLRFVRLAEGVFGFLAVAAGAVLLATLAQGYLRFGPAGRLTLLVAGGGTVVTAFWWGVILPLRHEPNEKETARFVETRLPELGNSLINTLLLTEHADEWSGPLVDRAIGEAAAAARGVDLRAAVSTRRARHRGIAAGVALVLLAVYVLLALPRFVSAGRQILSPFDRGIASVGAVRFTVTPGTVDWPKGKPMDVVAELTTPVAPGRTFDARITLTETGTGRTLDRPLVTAAARPAVYTYRVPQVLVPLEYRVTIGGTESKVFRVSIREPLEIARLDLTYLYPDYTALAPQTVEDATGEVACLVGTDVHVTVRTTVPADAGSLLFGSGRAPVKCGINEDRTALTGRFTVFESDTYRVQLEGDGAGSTPVVFGIKAVPDAPPTVAFTVPRADVVAPPGDTVRLGLKAADRYGLATVELFVQAEGEPEPRRVRLWTTFADPKQAVLDHGLLLEPDRYRLGQTLTYWAVATDGRLYQGRDTPRGPNRAETARYKVRVQDPVKAAQEKVARLNALYERLREVLKAQRAARTVTSTLAPMKRADAVRTAGSGLAQAQDAIRDATLAVTREVAFDDDTVALKETLQLLATNEMRTAVVKARAVAEVPDDGLAAVPELAGVLAADQEIILQILERLLDIVPRLADAVREEQKKLAASDLPPDALAKLKALRDRLKEFVEEQKRVIEASKDLAKRPVDDFQEADQRELERLKAIEDEWDKFLTEAIADFSKVPDLDASNPSLVRELIEVKTDVEMAADALAKKATDIVVPLEELGMEGAEEIVENLERWLPDTPDREKWQQEEAVGDVEIPHAELPEQMEDLVGELLEQEEDLFEEIDDVTSGAGDSIDKGAGWDAMDGPISSFSAKGVTGNRLPNTSEIGGRSGEGRTGKASGEFVEEEATGKGGRRTPTRLSPDAFSLGEVKDSSEEAPTGATGGGKMSGAGSEGLEGPVPQEVQRRMGALAGKQAQLRNKAEGVRAALQVRNYDSFTLDAAIDEMRKVQRDILAGRYTNALRRRDVILENLKSSKMLLGGEIRVRKDASRALPTAIQDEVLDALEKPMPRGYEDYLKLYYERLSEGD